MFLYPDENAPTPTWITALKSHTNWSLLHSDLSMDLKLAYFKNFPRHSFFIISIPFPSYLLLIILRSLFLLFRHSFQTPSLLFLPSSSQRDTVKHAEVTRDWLPVSWDRLRAIIYTSDKEPKRRKEDRTLSQLSGRPLGSTPAKKKTGREEEEEGTVSKEASMKGKQKGVINFWDRWRMGKGDRERERPTTNAIQLTIQDTDYHKTLVVDESGEISISRSSSPLRDYQGP